MHDKNQGKVIQITEKGKEWVESQRETIESLTGMTLEEYLSRIGKALKEIQAEIEEKGIMAVVLEAQAIETQSQQ